MNKGAFAPPIDTKTDTWHLVLFIAELAFPASRRARIPGSPLNGSRLQPSIAVRPLTRTTATHQSLGFGAMNGRTKEPPAPYNFTHA